MPTLQLSPHLVFHHLVWRWNKWWNKWWNKSPDCINCQKEIKWTCKTLLKAQATLAGKGWCYLFFNRKSQWRCVENRHGCMKSSDYNLFITILIFSTTYNFTQAKPFLFPFHYQAARLLSATYELAASRHCKQLNLSSLCSSLFLRTMFNGVIAVQQGYCYLQVTGLIKAGEEGEKLKLLLNR